MADIFKLLSRSTKLQKHADRSSQPKLRIPSAGTPALPQSLRDTNTIPEQNEIQAIQGKKRKRGQLASGLEEGVPDFFANGSITGGGAVRAPFSPSPIGEEVARDTLLKGATVVSDCLAFEERKKVLRSHKLKVTLMDPSLEKAKSKRRKTKTPIPSSRSKLISVFPSPLLSFEELRVRYGVSKRLGENLKAQGYTTPTEVQLGSLPILLGDDHESGICDIAPSQKRTRSNIDLLTIAPTGSGKTLAFLIPIIQKLLNSTHKAGSLDERGGFVKAIILAPTHELTDQIVNEAKKLTLGTGLKAAAMKKGVHVAQAFTNSQNASQANGTVKADILVSTPLVLLHAIMESESAIERLPSIESLVLDEADVLLDPLFREQTLGIWNSCINPKLQVSLWSATVGSSIETLARETIMQRRKDLGLSSSGRHIVRLIAGLKDSALPTISHKLVYAASEQGKLLAIRQLLHPSSGTATEIAALRPPFIVFTQTIERATALHSELLYDIPVEAGGSSRIAVLHSSLSETVRSNIMADFRNGEIWVIITTDLLARGVDFRGVNGIVNYDIPNTGAAYVHRAGRTGRAGREGGMAVTLYTKEDIPYVKNIANVIAASEKVHGKSNTTGGSGVQKWLLDALPNVSKKAKQELKKRGVEARRSQTTGSDGGREVKRSRISTKSGFERRLENKRKGTIAASIRKLDNDGNGSGNSEGSDDEWAGFE